MKIIKILFKQCCMTTQLSFKMRQQWKLNIGLGRKRGVGECPVLKWLNSGWQNTCQVWMPSPENTPWLPPVLKVCSTVQVKQVCRILWCVSDLKVELKICYVIGKTEMQLCVSNTLKRVPCLKNSSWNSWALYGMRACPGTPVRATRLLVIWSEIYSTAATTILLTVLSKALTWGSKVLLLST